MPGSEKTTRFLRTFSIFHRHYIFGLRARYRDDRIAMAEPKLIVPYAFRI